MYLLSPETELYGNQFFLVEQELSLPLLEAI